MASINNIGFTGGINSITNGMSAAKSAQTQQEMRKFQGLIDAVMAADNKKSEDPNLSTLSTSQVISNNRLNGDFTTGFAQTNKSPANKSVLPSGAAANSASESSPNGKIDKTSKLYEKSLELESYFVKMMLSSMRGTISKTNLNGKDNEYARNMYEDMMYDELSVSMTKNAGFGLADQIYLSLNK